MWSMGKVLQTPEVLRVYVGSFWKEVDIPSSFFVCLRGFDVVFCFLKPLRNEQNRKLFEKVSFL
jgi:hypothetical protein